MTPSGPGAGTFAGNTLPETFDAASAAAFVARASEGAVPGRFTAISLRVPRFDPIPALGLTHADESFYWRDRDGRVLAGRGLAVLLNASGADRIASIRGQAAALAAELDRASIEGEQLPPLPFFGGFAFAPGAADEAPWSGFGDARFLLPELCYYAERDVAWLTLTLSPDTVADAAFRDAAVARVRDVLSDIETGAEGDDGGPADAALDTALRLRGQRQYAMEGERQAFTALVRAALLRLDGGGLTKLVVARRTSVPAPAELDLPNVLRRLRRAVGTFRFAFAVDGCVFLGATPERLVARERDLARTEALAGTAPADDDATPIESSEKERREHEIVVRSITQSIGPLCSVLSYDPVPLERRAGPVRHLSTRFECTVEASSHVLDLVERLHPTPAVGGWPTPAAVDWLARHENMDRGWYAAPIGWFDVHGMGEFAVALRCGVLRPGTLDLFAGAGVVAGSDPDAEFDETCWKMAALPDALETSS